MKNIFYLLLLVCSTSISQTSLTLDSCISRAKKHYPLIAQNELNSAQTIQNLKGINEAWLPKLSFGAQAVYQTEVVSLDFAGMTSNFPHDSYVTSLGLDQTLFDGGQTKDQRNIEHLNNELENQKTEVELYKLIDRINQLYVSILLGRENMNVLKLYKDDLTNRRKNMANGVANGLILESNLSELDAEILKTEQNTIELKYSLQSLYRTLTYFIDQEVSDNTLLETSPIGGSRILESVNRAELKVFSIQKELMKSKYALTTDFALPKISLGAAGNYGRPGPNFINQDLRFFGSANITVKWNISSLYGLNRERKKYELSTSFIDIQQEVFTFNLNSTLITQNAQIEAMKEVISKDVEIVEKRNSVSRTAVSQVENGKITIANYLLQINAELQAKLNMKIHEIKLMNAISTINTTKGLTNY